MGHVVELPLHGAIPMVLNGVVSPAFEDLGDLSPLVLELSMHHEKDPLLFFAPSAFLDLGVQMVVPSLSALLANPLRQILRNHRPFLGSYSLDQLNENYIFLGGPCSFIVVTLVHNRLI
jgi:hypothetical protein